MEEDAAVVAVDVDKVDRLVVAVSVGVRLHAGELRSVPLVHDHLDCDRLTETGHLERSERRCQCTWLVDLRGFYPTLFERSTAEAQAGLPESATVLQLRVLQSDFLTGINTIPFTGVSTSVDTPVHTSKIMSIQAAVHT